MPAAKIKNRYGPKQTQHIVDDEKPHKKAVLPPPVKDDEEPVKAKKGSKTPAAEKSYIGPDGIPQIRGEYKVVPVTEIRPNQWNYNSQSDFMYEKLKESIKKFGFTEPLNVRSANEDGPLGYYEIIGGEHRWKASQELGIKELPIIDVGMMTDNNLKKLMIVLNETKGRPNNDQLALVISELSKAGDDISVLPFDEAEIQSLTSMGEFEWEQSSGATVDDTNGEGSSEEGDDDSYESITDIIGYEDMEQETDERIAKRLKAVSVHMKYPSDRPYIILDRLLDKFYEATEIKENVKGSDDE